jgi:hypothetical protein
MPTSDAPGVLRWVITRMHAGGYRALAEPMQGRYTYPTEEEAHRHMRAILENNSPTRLEQIYGAAPRFEVRETECWPGHHDPKGCYFDDHPAAPGL